MSKVLRDAEDWDDAYNTTELIWKAAPNQWVRVHTERLQPATALDLASGEGRNAVWLADRGWEVTAVDFSTVAMDKAKELATKRGEDTASRIRWVVADLLSYDPVAEYDLVMVIYLQFPADQRRTVLQRAAAAVAPGGVLLVVAHHTDNLSLGVGGPQDPRFLYSEHDVLADIGGFPDLIPRTAQRVERIVEGQPRPALDLVVEAVRPGPERPGTAKPAEERGSAGPERPGTAKPAEERGSAAQPV